MNNNYVPDHDLEPPADKRRAVYSCGICKEDILEGEDYYDLPELGECCTRCVEGCWHCDAGY